jgi:hypothetical protein
MKGDGAKAKWLSSSTKRLFTIDYGSQTFYYSYTEDQRGKITVIRFRDVTRAEQLHRTTQTTSGCCCIGSNRAYGFRLNAANRTYEFYTNTDLDARQWVDGLNAARDVVAKTSGTTLHERRYMYPHFEANPLKTSMRIGYIGSSNNLEDETVKGRLCELLSSLVASGAQVYVGQPNSELTAVAPARIVVQDMQNIDINMLNCVIVTPGGPGAEKEAQRFRGHAKLYCLRNSASQLGAPPWFDDLATEGVFDLNNWQLDRATKAIMGRTPVTSITTGTTDEGVSVSETLSIATISLSNPTSYDEEVGQLSL